MIIHKSYNSHRRHRLIQATTCCLFYLCHSSLGWAVNRQKLQSQLLPIRLQSPSSSIEEGIRCKRQRRVVFFQRSNRDAETSTSVENNEHTHLTTNLNKIHHNTHRSKFFRLLLSFVATSSVLRLLLLPLPAGATTTLAETAATTTTAATATAAGSDQLLLNSAELILRSPVSWQVEFGLGLRLILAALMGACVGKERSETHKHAAGIRTMALVSVGAACFTICSMFGFLLVGSHKYDPSRMASNIATGVGFVGAGVITTTSREDAKNQKQSVIHGLTTATAIWISAGIGIACGVGMYTIATTAAITTVGILRLGRNKKKLRQNTSTSSSTSKMKATASHPPPSPTMTINTTNKAIINDEKIAVVAMTNQEDSDDGSYSIMTQQPPSFTKTMPVTIIGAPALDELREEHVATTRIENSSFSSLQNQESPKTARTPEEEEEEEEERWGDAHFEILDDENNDYENFHVEDCENFDEDDHHEEEIENQHHFFQYDPVGKNHNDIIEFEEKADHVYEKFHETAEHEVENNNNNKHHSPETTFASNNNHSLDFDLDGDFDGDLDCDKFDSVESHANRKHCDDDDTTASKTTTTTTSASATVLGAKRIENNCDDDYQN